MIRRLAVVSQVKPFCGGAEAKASLNRATKLVAIDAKPRELRMGRMKWG
jgi:CDGSH-type Zn-finger protein